ncbi:polyamine aminopropyltransferase [Streptomyces daliensis]
MIDRPFSHPEHARLPVPAGLGRGLVLGSVFVCAACGLVYELELVALASYLAGDSVTQASVVLSVMVFAMGVGSLVAKRLRCRAAVGFGVVEALLALVGGCSAMALYASFAWAGEARIALVVFSFAIGLLIGAEMPLLMTLIQRIRQQDAGGAVADLFAADYVGALVGGLTFPFLLLPFFGQLTGALLTGVVNVLAGGVVVLWLFRHDLSARARWGMGVMSAAVVLFLAACMSFTVAFERAARDAVYGGDVRVALRSDVQELVLTGSTEPAPPGREGEHLELFLDGRLRVSSADESRFHEGLVHPAMADGPRARVLILGGGDGLALREVLRYAGVREVTVVELDPEVTRLGRTDPGLRRLNADAHRDPRVKLESGDAFQWLRAHARKPDARPYDVIVSDLPDPAISPSTKLYSQEFYGLASRALARNGRLAVHAGAPGERPRDYWTVESTMRAVGLRTSPYVVDGRLSGFTSGPNRSVHGGGGSGERDEQPRDWGYVLASRGEGADGDGDGDGSGDGEGALPVRAQSGAGVGAGAERGRGAGSGAPRSRSLTASDFREARARAERGRITGLPPSSLMRPRYLE